MSRGVTALVVGVTLIYLGCFLIWPILETLRGAVFDSTGIFTFAFIAEVFANPIYLEGLQNAVLLAVWSTLAATLLALPLAWVSDRFIFPGKAAFSSLILVPMILPPFVGAIGVKHIFGQAGALNALLIDFGFMAAADPIDWLGHGRFWGVVIMNALHLYPILYLNLTAALANIDPALEEAAENLGCTGFRRFRRVTLPLLMPGFFAGAAIVFIWAFTELGVPLMFGFGRVTSVQIFHGLKDIAGNPFPYALVAVMLIASTLLYLASRWLLGRSGHAMIAKSASQGGARKPGTAAQLLCCLLFGLVGFVAILPHLGVVLVAFSANWYESVLPTGWTLEHFQAALGHELTLPSIRNSLRYAALSTLVDLILGVGIAYVVVRTRFFGKAALDALAMLPLAVPGLVLAFGYVAMTREGQVFAFLNPLVDPLAILVIAYSVRRLPYVVRSAAAGFQQTSPVLEEAAQNLGATPLTAMRKITLPLISANLIAGGMLAFSFAMLEVSDSLILAQRQADFPITKAIFELYNLLGDGPYIACALGTWAMVFLAVALAGASLLLGKKLGALFRSS